MARASQESSSKRHFHWTKKIGTEEEDAELEQDLSQTLNSSQNTRKSKISGENRKEEAARSVSAQGKKLQAVAVARLRSVLATLGKNRGGRISMGLGNRVVGTLFGSRRGHVHFALQREPSSPPAFLVELATPISGLVKEMASGLVRIALECDKEKEAEKKGHSGVRLLEEPKWRTFCNGKKCGSAIRRECGPKEWKVLKAVEPISMGAGVLPSVKDNNDNNNEVSDSGLDCGEAMFMRAKFERIVGSRDSEAYYMMNPDSNGAPELSIYLLRI